MPFFLQFVFRSPKKTFGHPPAQYSLSASFFSVLSSFETLLMPFIFKKLFLSHSRLCFFFSILLPLQVFSQKSNFAPLLILLHIFSQVTFTSLRFYLEIASSLLPLPSFFHHSKFFSTTPPPSTVTFHLRYFSCFLLSIFAPFFSFPPLFFVKNYFPPLFPSHFNQPTAPFALTSAFTRPVYSSFSWISLAPTQLHLLILLSAPILPPLSLVPSFTNLPHSLPSLVLTFL